ncbi:MAG: BNR-4 repeat-containing protein [Chitinophagaceae bacterium]
MLKVIISLFAVILSLLSYAQHQVTLNRKDDGFRGIWYSNQPSNDEYVFKYSGGLGTYPANHYPFSIYSSKVDKTFFCYGGTDKSGKTLLHMVSYFDHKTGMVTRPVIILDKQTDDAHDNPVINIDRQGYIWIFSTSHGVERPSYVHRSTKPYDINHFSLIDARRLNDTGQVPLNNFSYLQSWYIPARSFINLFTHYEKNVVTGYPDKSRRTISFMTSKDGITWSDWQDLAAIEEGHYQTSGQFGTKIGSSFNFHPIKPGEAGLNYRSNLYYLETPDFGKSWQTAGKQKVSLPLREIKNPALVKDYFSQGLNVYINDVTFGRDGNPVILYITSKGYEAGPGKGPRSWFTARWTGQNWEIFPVTESDNNYDMGSLYIEADGTWRIIGPTLDGPQQYNTGGEMVMWISKNKGQSWTSLQMTANSRYNHSYARRPVSAHPDFYALWADGHGRKQSESTLYFSNSKGDVFVLPREMQEEFVKPLPR